jgi:hypothetical protein
MRSPARGAAMSNRPDHPPRRIVMQHLFAPAGSDAPRQPARPMPRCAGEVQAVPPRRCVARQLDGSVIGRSTSPRRRPWPGVFRLANTADMRKVKAMICLA